ncbi:hemagglutinin repeat-containing protein [Fusobacterium massiliense]
MKSGDILGGIASTTNTVTGIVSGLASNQGTKLPTSAVNKNNSNDDDDDDDNDKNNQTNTVGKDNLKAAQATNNFYANVGVNFGYTKSSSKTNSYNESAVVTTIKGKDENSSITYNAVKNVEYVGTQAQDTKFIYNNVENITKKAVELKNYSLSSSKSSGISTGVTIGYGDGIQTSVDAVKVSASQSKMNSNGTSYQNGRFVNVDEVHNNTKNMTLSGFNQEGGTVTGNIENLTIESKQNTSITKGRTIGGSLSIAPNGMPSGSANYSQTNGERRVVDNASTFIVGDGSNLKVGKVENTASAIGTSGNGKLSIDEYVGHNLENVDKLKTVGGSVGVSASGVNNIGVNYSDRKQEGITKNTVIGNVEIGKSSGDEINKDLGSMTEITKDRDFKTDINIESQTINYIKNPEKFKEDLQKAKNEIHDIYHAVDSTVNLQGKEDRNILEQLGEVRQAKVILNVIGSRLDIAENQDDIAKAFEGVSEDLDYKVKVIYTDPSNSPQLIGVDKNGNKYIKDGTAYVDKDTGIGYILVNTESPANSTKAGVIGTIAEEQSHVIGKKEGRQKVVSDGSEKGLESLGKPTNDYFKKQYSKNDKAIELKSDGKDYSNVDFGEHVGDKVVKDPLKSYGREFITTDERKQAEKILSKEKGNKYIIDWVRYDNITETNYRAKINYLVFEAKNRVNDLSEIEKGNFEDVNDKEAVYHNFTEDGKIILDDNMKNQKKVEYETGREVVITPNDEIVKEPRNQGTGNYITYGLKESKSDEGKFDKFGHGIVDIGTYLFFGTGVNDNSTFINRMSYFTKGTLVSINYKGIKKWSDSRGYKAVGYKEIFEYLITPNFYEQYRDDTRYKNFIETNIIR